jgi:arylsulfatase
METVDEEFLASALDFMERKTKEGGPWFCYMNTTRMHVWTHLKPESDGKTGLGLYPDGMVELDGIVGRLLDKLDELGVADNTAVVFTTDNGAEKCTWPDGGQSPFRGEKDTNWEGGWRVPCVMRWPGVIEPGRVINDITSLQDFIPTFAAAAGEDNLVEKVKKGYTIGNKSYKVHLDGFNLLPFLSGEEEKCPREGFLYWSDDGDLLALRAHEYKIHFKEQRADPFESADISFLYDKWSTNVNFAMYAAQPLVGKWLESFKEFPPRARAASFSIDQVVEKLMPKA